MEIPVEIILGIVQPTAEAVEHQRQFLLVQRGPPVGAGNLVDRRLDADLGEVLLDQHDGRLADRRGAGIER